MSRPAVHWNETGPERPLVTGEYEPACHATSPAGLWVTREVALVTCARCGRWAAGLVQNVRSRRPQLSRIPLGEQTDDGVSYWSVWGGRFWRVWPVAGHDRGWHLEEVTEDGSTAGHVALDRRDSRAPFKWVGGHYEVVATLAHARERIAELAS